MTDKEGAIDIGTYRLGKLVASDERVETWEAEDTTLRRPVVVRIVREGADEHACKAFETSVRNGADPTAPGVVLRLDRTRDGRAYAVYEGTREAASSGSTAPAADVTRVARRPRGRRGLIIGLAAAVLVVAAAAVVVLVWRPWADRRPVVAVLPTDSTAVLEKDWWIAAAFDQEFQNYLTQVREVRIVSRDRAAALKSDLTTSQAARALGADFVGKLALKEEGAHVSAHVQIFSADGTSRFDDTRVHDSSAEPATTIHDLADFAVTAVDTVAVPNSPFFSYGSLTSDSRAMEYAMQAWSTADWKVEIPLLQKALEYDPNYLFARRRLYVAYLNLRWQDPANFTKWDPLWKAALADYKTYLAKVPLDSFTANVFRFQDAHNAGDFSEGYRLAPLLLKISPDDLGTLYSYQDFCTALGKLKEARQVADRLFRLYPDSELACENYIAMFTSERNYRDGMKVAKQALAKFPESWNVTLAVRTLSLASGNFEEARAAQAAATKLGDLGGPQIEGYIAAVQGRREEALAEADAEAEAFHAGTADLGFAVETYAALGMKDQAIELLSNDNINKMWMAGAGASPFYDPLRSDPRFQALLKKWGVVENVPAGVKK